MLFTFKTLAGQAFQLECDDTFTIAETKQQITKEKGADLFPVDSQRLIYNGKVLNDEQKMGDLKYDEGKFIVLMISKNKLPVALQPAASEPVSAVAAAQPIVSETAADVDLDSPAAVSEEKADGHVVQDIAAEMSNDPLQVTPPSNELVMQLENMGYPRDEAIRALAAANNNVNVAVEYLVNGIEDSSSNEDAGQSAPGELNFLRHIPQFEQIRQMIRSNPAVLPQILQQMGAVNPELMGAVSANPQEFLRILNEPLSADPVAVPAEHAQPPQQEQQQVIAISQEDREAIDRIRTLGFSEQQAIEAYIACEKNEMLAANYLFNQMEQEGNQSGRDSGN